ncbi:MAG: PD40 domain-containing protein, partial [Bacteroidetes bacterium]|nr:PD40 domain-containing protein [Bacteroidota bacterium]
MDPNNTQFGKNRIQYQERYWFFYNFENFDVFFYPGGEKLAESAAKYTEAAINEIEHRLNYDLEEKIQLVIYNKLSDFQQSNIGLSGENQISLAGKARIQGSKVFMYFEGDYNKFHDQIRMVIIEMMINNIMYGGGIKERIRSEVFITLPEWYSKGLISFMTNPTEININNKIRDGFIHGTFDKFNNVSGEVQTQLGHALWAYIAQVYGEKVIANILYMTHMSRNIETGFLYIMNVSLRNLYTEFLAYNKAVYKGLEENGTQEYGGTLIKKPKSDYSYYQAKISPDGQKLIYASNIMGQYKVWMKEMGESKRAKKMLRVGHKLDRMADMSYPILAWHPTGELFSMITERKGRIWLSHYKFDKKKFQKREIFKFEKVLTMDYAEDGRKLVFSAVNKGQSDIYIYTLASSDVKRITDDIYDDADPKFINGTSKIVFSSNRPGDTIRFDFRQKS